MARSKTKPKSKLLSWRSARAYVGWFGGPTAAVLLLFLSLRGVEVNAGLAFLVLVAVVLLLVDRVWAADGFAKWRLAWKVAASIAILVGAGGLWYLTSQPVESGPKAAVVVAPPDETPKLGPKPAPLSLSFNPPDTSCAKYGAGTEPISDWEMGLPKGIPRLYDEIAGLVGRMAQADKDKIEVLTGAIEDWRIRVGNRLDVAYGPLAQVDAVSAKPTDALLIAIPVDRRAALNEAAISALRQAGGMLSCLRAIELNLAKRPPHVGV